MKHIGFVPVFRSLGSGCAELFLASVPPAGTLPQHTGRTVFAELFSRICFILQPGSSGDASS